MPEVSVIIPVYNNEKFIGKCLRSVMRQTFSDMEILVIDDGSTDNSRTKIRALASRDCRIRLFSQPNQGVSAARNRGLDAASGTYIAFIDGDDYIHPDYIQKLHDYAEKNNTEMLICGFTSVDENGKVLNRLIPGAYRRFEKEEWTFRVTGVWAHLYRRDLWEKYHVRFRIGERGEDMPVALFFSAVCDRISTVPETGYCYVQHPDSAMHNFKGLKTYSLPYQGLEETIKKIRRTGISNSPEFYELFVLRILATCLFELAPGAPRRKKKELCDYIVRILNTWFPDYAKNKKTRLTADLEIPFVQKAAVKVLIILTRTGLIYPVSRLL